MVTARQCLDNQAVEDLFFHGVSYDPLLDRLLIAERARGNRALIESCTSQGTVSPLISFVCTDQGELPLVGIEYKGVAQLAAYLTDCQLPMPCATQFFADIMDQWLQDFSYYGLLCEGIDRGQAQDTHNLARAHAESFGEIPDPIRLSIQAKLTTFKEIRTKFLH